MAQSSYLAMSDEELISSARTGDTGAYAELWKRHSAAALRAARQFTSIADADDLVAEAYLRILVALKDGGGPTGAFRPYLFVTIRNLAIHLSRAPHNDNVEDFDQIIDSKSTADPSIVALDRSLTVRAFRSLPESWQTVLWYTEVESMKPREVAPLLGMTANTVAALAYRARDALRTAWIQAHVNDEGTSAECKWMLERVGKYSRGQLSAREQARADDHIDSCARCIIVVEEADDIGSRLALVLLPIMLGGAAGAAYRLEVQGQQPAPAQAATATGSTTGAGLGVQLAIAASAIVLVGSAAAMAVSVISTAQNDAQPVAAPTETSPVEQPVVAEPPTEEPTELPADPREDPPTPAPPSTPAPVVPDPVDPPPVDPDPDPDPDLDPVDTVALPPTVTTVIANDTLVRPSLEGTAEPLATITIVDQAGEPLASTTADETGAWSTGTLESVTPTTTMIAVTQTDVAGNPSPATELGPLAFHPVILTPGDGFSAVVDEWFTIELAGWTDVGLHFSMTGDNVVDGYQETTFGVEPDGTSSMPAIFNSAGTTTLSIRYLDADPLIAQSITITIVD